MVDRVELAIIEKSKNIIDFFEKTSPYEIISIYFLVDLSNISFIREYLIKQNYTTRLFIHIDENGMKKEYIYGKLKGKNGVFNEHCKNSVFRKNIQDIVNISSNSGDSVIIDVNSNIIVNENRNFIYI